MDVKVVRRKKIHYRIRKKVMGTAQNLRLSVFRSNKDTYAQLIDDDKGITVAASSTREKDIAAQKLNKTELAKLAGASLGRKARELGVTKVVFDRSGYLYHGRVKAVADGAREAGLEF